MLKEKIILCTFVALNFINIFAITPKDINPNKFKNCERIIFSELDISTSEQLYCYNENIQTNRYLRLIGVLNNNISHDIQLRLDVDPDSVEYLKIENKTIRFIINGIEGYEEYFVDLNNNQYRILSKKTNDEFWNDFAKVPFNKKMKSSVTGKNMTLNPFSINFNNNKKQGLFESKDGMYIFSSDNEQYIVLFTEFYSTCFVTLLQKNHDNNFPYNNESECFYYSFRNNKSIPQLKSVKIQEVGDFIIEINSKNNKIEYSPITDFSISKTPWAVREESRNKYITVRVPDYDNSDYPLKYLVFVNGFVNAEKTYLFKQNSRAKKIQIKTNSFLFETELIDTANYQLVELPKALDDEIIIIKVLSDYKGTKYSDIVISGIYYMDAEGSKNNE